jgi:hypothetical protein
MSVYSAKNAIEFLEELSKSPLFATKDWSLSVKEMLSDYVRSLVKSLHILLDEAVDLGKYENRKDKENIPKEVGVLPRAWRYTYTG